MRSVFYFFMAAISATVLCVMPILIAEIKTVCRGGGKGEEGKEESEVEVEVDKGQVESSNGNVVVTKM